MNEKSYLKQVQAGIDYIEQHLEFDISLAGVAREAGISQWHFQRIFKALTNETLKTYIRSRRLGLAMQKLISGNDRILDIAIAAGYESQESFTRVFKKAFDLSPHAFRKLGDKNMFPLKIQFDQNYLNHIHHHVSLEPDLVAQRSMLLVGMHTKFYSVDSEKNNIGEKLPQLWQAFQLRVAEISFRVAGVNYGVVLQSRDNPEELDYHAAIEVNQIPIVPAGMSLIKIPPAEYVRFTHRGPANKIDHTVNYIYSSWLLQSGRRHSYGADLEIYDHLYHPTADDSVMYYAVPID